MQNVIRFRTVQRTVIGSKNPHWKQEVNLGKRTNQAFVNIPHARFINQLRYKAALVGITVVLTEESYTSKCSFLDNEAISKHETYMGKRKHRACSWLRMVVKSMPILTERQIFSEKYSQTLSPMGYRAL